ncbi:MAG: hypothetical protein AAF721_29420 [Myxococcota bacterium]
MRAGFITQAIVFLGISAGGCDADGSKPTPTDTPAAASADAPRKPAEAKVPASDTPKPGPPATPVPEDPPIAVPPPPDYAATAPRQYPDGAWSVSGLRLAIETNEADGQAGVEARLRAYVTRVPDPTPCPEGEICAPGPPPHVWVADTQGETNPHRMLRVVGAVPSKGEAGAPRKGTRYDVTGTFTRLGQDHGFVDDLGLMIAKQLDAAKAK